jgi:hypothetical protein
MLSEMVAWHIRCAVQMPWRLDACHVGGSDPLCLPILALLDQAGMALAACWDRLPGTKGLLLRMQPFARGC